MLHSLFMTFSQIAAFFLRETGDFAIIRSVEIVKIRHSLSELWHEAGNSHDLAAVLRIEHQQCKNIRN